MSCLHFYWQIFFFQNWGMFKKKNIQRKMTFISWVDRGLVSWYLSRSIYDVIIIIINVANDEADFLFSFSFWSRICKINAFFSAASELNEKKIYVFFKSWPFSNSNQNSIIIIWTWNWYLFFFFILLQIIFWREKNSSSS